jgi:hypothetical protein
MYCDEARHPVTVKMRLSAINIEDNRIFHLKAS